MSSLFSLGLYALCNIICGINGCMFALFERRSLVAKHTNQTSGCKARQLCYAFRQIDAILLKCRRMLMQNTLWIDDTDTDADTDDDVDYDEEQNLPQNMQLKKASSSSYKRAV